MALRSIRRAPAAFEHGRAQVLYLTGASALVLIISFVAAFRPVWVETALGYWDERWSRRLSHAESLVDSGRHRDAVAYLERLDADFPAQFVKHKRDTQREHLLEMLAAAQEAIGRRASAIRTYERLTEFDGRNYRNHYLLATACLRDNEHDRAIQQFQTVLSIHPSHAASVEMLIRHYFDRAAFGDVVATFERYVDALVFRELTLEADGNSAVVAMPIDGMFHRVELVIPIGSAWTGELVISGIRETIEVGDLTVHERLTMGRSVDSALFRTTDRSVWSSDDLSKTKPGFFSASEGVGTLRATVDDPTGQPARFELPIRLLKPLSRGGWERVEKSYRNLLEPGRLAQMSERVWVNG